MTSPLAGAILAMVAGLIAWLYPRFLSPEPESQASEVRCRLRDLPELFRAVAAAGVDGCFAAMLVPPVSGSDPNERAYIQFSIESGRIGVDWVLESQQNIRDQQRFSDIASSLGYSVQMREMSDVRYLRVEDGDLPRLASAALEQLYRVGDRTILTLQTDGFEWSSRS